MISARAVSAAGIVDPTPDRDVVFLGQEPAPGSVYPIDGRQRVTSPVVTIVAQGPAASTPSDCRPRPPWGRTGDSLAGMDLPVGGNAYSYLAWNLVDPAYAGTPGDGHKEVFAQWRDRRDLDGRRGDILRAGCDAATATRPR